MADGPKKFGRYFLLDMLAQGGMAEIYRARLASADGAGRVIVIKRIQSGYGNHQEFLQMFRSEIKVTMGFNHPNIAQLYDFGEESEQPYIAMEWVDGKNLRQFISRFAELKQKFPIDLAVQIIEQAACGLHYAHQFKDKISGQSLNIVHRDISPQNVLISFEGSVKVIDFGIAKATVNNEATRAGVIKGKPSYLSPEQINGDVLDGRSDIFSLGTVLWELLAGKKLFSGENDLAVLKMIESCNTYVKPPSTINPDVPRELDYIALKALAKQRDKRYQTAEELQRALHKFLYSESPDFNPSDLAYYAKDLFKKEIVDDRKKIQRLNEEVERLIQDPATAKNTSAGILEMSVDDSAAASAAPKPESEESTVVATKGKPTFSVFEPEQRSLSSIMVDRSQKTVASPRYRSRTSTKIQEPIRTSEGSGGFGGLVKVLGGLAAAAAVLIFFGKHFSSVKEMFDGTPRVEANRSTASTPDTAPAQEATPSQPSTENEPENTPIKRTNSIVLRLNISPGGGEKMIISVNGKRVNPDNPLIRVPLDSTLELAVDRVGYKPFYRQFFVESKQAGTLDQWVVEVPLEPKQFGYLNVRSTPSADVQIMLDGKAWVKKTPFENEKIPVGTYLITLKNELLGMEKTEKIKIEEGKIVNLDERLEIKDQ